MGCARSVSFFFFFGSCDFMVLVLVFVFLYGFFILNRIVGVGIFSDVSPIVVVLRNVVWNLGLGF